MAVPVLALAGFFINREGSFGGGLLPYAFFLLCPLMHIFMMFPRKNVSEEESAGKKTSCH
jgi:hypothetical protein